VKRVFLLMAAFLWSCSDATVVSVQATPTPHTASEIADRLELLSDHKDAMQIHEASKLITLLHGFHMSEPHTCYRGATAAWGLAQAYLDLPEPERRADDGDVMRLWNLSGDLLSRVKEYR